MSATTAHTRAMSSSAPKVPRPVTRPSLRRSLSSRIIGALRQWDRNERPIAASDAANATAAPIETSTSSVEPIAAPSRRPSTRSASEIPTAKPTPSEAATAAPIAPGRSRLAFAVIAFASAGVPAVATLATLAREASMSTVPPALSKAVAAASSSSIDA